MVPRKPQKRRSFFLFLGLIFLCSLIGGIFGPQVQAAATVADSDDIGASLKSFTSVYGLVEQNFADKIDPDKNGENPWGRVTLRAPFDGIIVERNVHVDEMVLDQTVNLFHIADVSRLTECRMSIAG